MDHQRTGCPLPDTGTRLLVLCAVTALLLRDLGLVRFWLPENQRQVPQSVVRKPGLEAAFQFGAELGVGVRTYVSSAAPYILGIAIVLVPAGWTAAVVAACGFALGRAAMPVTRLLSQQAGTWDELLARRLAWLVGCSAALAAMLATTLVLAA